MSIRIVALACILWALSSCGSEQPLRPNVLLISLDTFRADYLHHAPYLEDLARQGRSFPNMWASSNWTLPSHASILTGVPRPCPTRSPRGFPPIRSSGCGRSGT